MIFIFIIQIIGAEANDNFGYSVSSAGDFNNDGYDDIIIGAPYASPNSRPRAGTVYLIFGISTGFTNISVLSLDLVNNSCFGFKV